jgi:hypothetical protein
MKILNAKKISLLFIDKDNILITLSKYEYMSNDVFKHVV